MSEPFWSTAGTWRRITAVADSIAVTLAIGFLQLLSAGVSGVDRNPTTVG